MEEMDKLLQNMTQMKDDMSKMQDELKQYVLLFKDGKISVKIHGDGTISDLHSNEADDEEITRAINAGNAKVKEYISEKMESITPAEFRETNK